MRLLRWLRWIDSLSDWTGKIVCWIIVPLTLVVAYDVIMRYAFDRPTLWAYDVALHMWSFLFLLGGAYVLRHNAHIRVDVLFNRFPLRVRGVINLLFYLALLSLPAYFIVKLGIGYVHDSFVSGEVSRWTPLHEPIWFHKTFIPLGWLLLWLQAVPLFVRDLLVVIKGREP